jgi:hypothetical protein
MQELGNHGMFNGTQKTKEQVLDPLHQPEAQ